MKPEGARYAKEIPLLMNHRHDQPVGTVQLGKATKKGIPFKAQIPKVDEEGAVKHRTDEAWHSVKAGLVKGVSIGFRPEEYEPNDKGGLDFTKSEIHELSLCAIPCNPDAVINAFKNLPEVDASAATEEPNDTAQEEAEASRKAHELRVRKLLLSLSVK